MKLTFTFLLLAGLPALLADQVRTTDGGLISGRVTSLDSHALSLETELAAEAVQVKPDQVQSVTFDEDSVQRGDHDARVILINGDRLPCDLKRIDDKHVHVATRYSEDLKIARKSISSLQLGIRPRQTLYQGPSDSEDWTVDDAWSFENGVLTSISKGSAFREVEDLPSSFSLQFQIEWTQIPNLEFYFCSSEARAGGGKLDRYYLQFNSAGFGIQRQSSGDTTYQSLGEANLLPDSFTDSKALVEIRVDRKIRRIELLIDGEVAGRYNDPLPEAPGGSLFVLSSNSQASGVHRVSNIVVRAWSANRDRHDSEDRGDGEGDSLIDNTGQRFTGRLIGTGKSDKGMIFLFKNPHQEDPLQVPEDRVSTLFFAKPDSKSERPPMIIGLQEQGMLSVGACTFAGDEMKLTHPLLGEFSLKRNALTSMARRLENPPTDP
ncbi:MAG: hypothetical protein MUF31_04165 [Akkermansiaceae bacterium]|nr:hypothetical protein [Akkermansiaceae bacterium]